MKKTSGFWPLFLAPIFLALRTWLDFDLSIVDINSIYIALGFAALAAITLYIGFAVCKEPKHKFPTLIGGFALALATISGFAPDFFGIIPFLTILIAALMAVILAFLMTERKIRGILVGVILGLAISYSLYEELSEWQILVLIIAMVLVVLDYFGVFSKHSGMPKLNKL